MRIAVLGAGSLGSLLAGLLARTEDVLLVGHGGAHVDAIDREGLTVLEPDGRSFLTRPAVSTDHSDVAGVDLLVVAVKSYDTESAMADVEPYLDGTPVLTLQNGLGNVETIAEFVPERTVLAGTTTHGALVDAPGRVKHTGYGRTKIGSVAGTDSAFVDSVADVFERNDVETVVVEDVEAAIWEKVLINVGINAATALARVPNGRLASEPAGERLLERSVTEAEAVARAMGNQPGDDIVAKATSVAKETAENESSMVQDVTVGRRTEIDALNGAIVELGESSDIDVPVNRTLTDLIKLMESEFQ